MLFKPADTKLWDTFVLPHDGRFYLFYLQLRHEPWDGYGLAVSDDLVHWHDHGSILKTLPGETGMGAGTIWRLKDRWILNFSLGEEGSQRIYFAESTDLFNWRRLPRDIVCVPDPRWYECAGDATSGSARWDTIWAVPQDDGTYVGFVTATAKEAPAGANGVFALVTSSDGLHWTAGPPASAPSGIAWAEVGSYARFGPRHYLLPCSSSGLGPRFDPVYNPTGKAGGTYVMQSDNVRGPYRLVDGDPLLLGCRNAPSNWAYLPTYDVRTFSLGEQTLACHHWMPRDNFLDAWHSTAKILEEERPGKLVLKYWPGNEKLKGDTLFDLREAPPPRLPTPQAIPTGRWEHASGRLRGATGGTSLAWFETDACFGDGAIIEADITLAGHGAAGLFLGIEGHGPDKPYRGVGCLANRQGLYEFGRISQAPCGPAFMAENHVLRNVPEGAVLHWRALVRGEFVELYVDDTLVQCYGFSALPVRNVGLFVERGEADLSALRIHRFA